MSQRDVAIQLRQMASDPDIQATIGKDDQFVNGLIIFAEGKDEEVALIAIQALNFLSQHPSNKQSLAQRPNFLKAISKVGKRSNEHIQKFAQEIQSNLALAERKVEKKRKKKKLHAVKLNVDLMTTIKQKNQVESALVNVKGVISVTFSATSSMVTVFTYKKEKSILPFLISSIEAQTGLRTQAYNVSFAPSLSADKENSTSYSNSSSNSNSGYPSTPNVATKLASDYSTPSYDDDTAPATAGAYLDSQPSYLNNMALTEHGGSSLQSRFEKQKKLVENKQKKQQQAQSFLGKVTSFFW